MERILRAHVGWEDEVAEALRRVPRPIAVDERLLPRTPDGLTTREQYDRSGLPPARAAATLLALYPGERGELVAPLTVRRSELREHAGEVSLPGGTIDAEDASPQAAALREAWEEVGLDPSLVRVLGELDPVWIPVSNFELVPVVGAVAQRPTLVPHDAEVAAIVEIPVRALFDPAVLADEEFVARGITIRAGVYRHGQVTVWGATALTLGMFARVLDAGPPSG